MPRPSNHRPGFTLIELLVVISIIALLIAILMPALGSARRSAELVQSLNNLSQIGKATKAYATEHDNNLPIDSVKVNANSVGYCTWSFGGKFASSFWRTSRSGVFDLAPDSRPLNDYVYPGKLHPPVSGKRDAIGPARPANESERAPIELEIYRSPRDIASAQRNWPNPQSDISSYDDVGTSYRYNYRPINDLKSRMNTLSIDQPMKQTRQYWRTQQHFDPSRFVIYTDQVSDMIRSRQIQNGLRVIDGDYGLTNHSAMVFIDGHASYEKVIEGQDSGDNYDFTFNLK